MDAPAVSDADCQSGWTFVGALVELRTRKQLQSAECLPFDNVQGVPFQGAPRRARLTGQTPRNRRWTPAWPLLGRLRCGPGACLRARNPTLTAQAAMLYLP
jgi:hypothetical protein